jgi:hypothetical protein
MDKPFWPEIIEAGCAINTAAVAGEIIDGFHRLPLLEPNFQTPIFGVGNASQIIANDLLQFV